MSLHEEVARREFLAKLGLATATGLLGSPLAAAMEQAATGMPADTPRELHPNGADLGSLLGDLEKLAARRVTATLPWRPLPRRQRIPNGSPQKVFDVLLYRQRRSSRKRK